VVFADDLILAIRYNSLSAVENYSKGELRNVTTWSKSKNIRINEEKSSYSGIEKEMERT